MFDPRDDKALKLHAKEVYKDEKMNDSEKMSNVKDSIYQAIVGLCDSRLHINVALKLYRDSIFYRSEIFDDSAIVTFYNQRQKFDTFPPSYQYEKQTIYYDIFNRDFMQTWNLATDRIEFIKDTDDSECEKTLGNYLVALGCEKSVDTLRVDYNRRKKEKIDQLQQNAVKHHSSL